MSDKIEERIAALKAAYRAMDFVYYGQIREELEDQGVRLEFGPEGITWSQK